jgi:hypothetical protein
VAYSSSTVSQITRNRPSFQTLPSAVVYSVSNLF